MCAQLEDWNCTFCRELKVECISLEWRQIWLREGRGLLGLGRYHFTSSGGEGEAAAILHCLKIKSVREDQADIRSAWLIMVIKTNSQGHRLCTHFKRVEKRVYDTSMSILGFPDSTNLFQNIFNDCMKEWSKKTHSILRFNCFLEIKE